MNVYQHFRSEEREFIDLVLHWKDYVQNTFAPKLTDFLDPREQQIIQALIGQQSDITFQFFGGTEKSERKRALIFPDYFQPGESDFQVSLFEINYPKKFIKLEHREVLGSLMSIGLKRGKFGDIIIADDRIQFFAASEIIDYVKMQLVSISRSKVEIEEVPLNQVIDRKEQWHEGATTVSSLRLDAVVSSVYDLSRQKSQVLINQRLVKVNWSLIENPSFECREGDVLSIRGYGRSKIIAIEGKTKKDKWRMIYGRQK